MGSTLSSILSTARTALTTHQTAIDVISHNIANAQTPGYSRQRAEITAGPSLITPAGVIGTGVVLTDVARLRDTMLDSTFRLDTAGSGFWQRRGHLLAEIEQLHGDITSAALPSALNAFWNAWSDLSTDPTSSTTRFVVRQTGDQLVNEFRRLSTGLDQVTQSAGLQLQQDIAQINRLAADIARINNQVVAAEAGGQTAGDLRDTRDRMIDELAGRIGVRAIEHANGSVSVDINGIKLVDGPDSIPLTIDTSGGTWNIVTARGVTLLSAGGAVGATVGVLNRDIPTARAELDTLAQALVSAVNAAHTTGMNAAGVTGLNFFEDNGNPATVTASTMALSSDIANAQSIAAGTGVIDPVSGNLIYAAGRNDVALAISALRTAPNAALGGLSLNDSYGASLTRLGSDLRAAEDNATIHATLASQADYRRSSVSGVSVDEELISLMRFQNAYAAAARVVSTADEMMQTILEMKR